MIELEHICKRVVEICEETANFISTEIIKISDKAVETKSLNSLVTYVDKTAEKMLVENLGALIPEAGFHTEEETAGHTTENYIWIIDPLDGTTNFIHGIYPHAISIALQYCNETVLGVVYELGQKECFYSWKGGKVYLNKKEVTVSKRTYLKEALLATGFPYYNYSLLEPFLNSLKFFMQNTRGVRRLGSAATDLAYVACGRFDCFYEYSLQAWDVAAGAFLVQQAGGRIADFSLENNYLYGGQIIACNAEIYEEFSSAIKLFFETKGK